MAERTPSTRSSTRRRAAPYPSSKPGRPTSSQATLTNIFTGIFNFILRPFSGQSTAVLPLSQSDSGTLNVPCALTLTERGEEMANGAHSQRSQQPPPAPAPAAVPPPPRRSPPQNQVSEPVAESSGTSTYNAVAAFLVEKAKTGQKLNTDEYLDLMPLLKPHVEDKEKREPFRFSNSPSFLTASSSGLNGLSLSNSASSMATSGEGQVQRAPRMLSKNPNGDLQWDGFGDARRRKQNRYQSDAFGRTRKSARISLNPKAFAKQDKPEVKGKKRRVEEPQQEASSSQPTGNACDRLAAPVPRTNGAPASPSTPPRARPDIKSRPVVPSPLRQAWGADPDSPPSAQSRSTASTSATRPTRAATAMAELIKEASPSAEAKKRRAAYANPYEEESPVPVKPTPRQNPWKRKVGQTEKPEEKAGAKKLHKETEKEVEKVPPQLPLSPQRIIEATVPKGAKRSRPPPGFENPKPKDAEPEHILRRSAPLKSPETAPATSGFGFFAQPNRPHPSLPAVIVQEVPDELPHKKAGAASGINGFPKSRTVTVEEIEDVDMPSSSKPTSSFVKPTEVIEIDDDEPAEKLKEKSPSPTSNGMLGANGFGNASKLSPLSPLGAKSSAPRVSSKLRYSFAADKEDMEEPQINEKGKNTRPVTNGLDLLSSAAVPSAPKLAPATLPGSLSFGTAATKPAGQSPFGAPGSSFFATSSTAPPPSSLFNKPSTASAPFTPAAAKPKTTEEIKNVVRVLAVVDLPVYHFEIALSSPGAGAGPSTLKAREAARAVSVSALPAFDFSKPKPLDAKQPSKSAAGAGFNWAAAGMKKPEATDEWACAECTLKNPASATDKCQICEAPRPGAAPAAPKAFDWSAAGMKPPAATDEWECAECTLKNSANVKEKCQWCEAKRPGAAPAATPAAGGFDWAAAGMKKPENAGGWTCGTCMVPNPASAAKCISCETDR